ncbi:hypothetical protein DFH09DRAFT_1306208 [Mycena vulgaris]|nr:hypothetical protein DFH09DRAFT_1306208 [Mycena vulgaris]
MAFHGGDTQNLIDDDATRIRPATATPMTRNLSCSTLGLATLSLLTSAEELRYKLDIAHDILNSREAEANVVQSLLVEAHAAVDRRRTEIKLATLLEIEAKRRLQYYSRMNEIASKNLTDAEMQVGSLRIEHRELGGPEEHNRVHRIKEEITDSDRVDFLLTLD